MTATSTELFDRALALHKQGRIAEALPLYRQAIETGPDFTELMIGAALAFAASNQPDEALRHLRRAVELGPDNAVAHAHFGTLLNEAGRFREALPVLARAVELDANDATSLTNLGCSYRALGRVDEALDCFQRAVRLAPDMAEIQSNLATTLIMQDRTIDAGLRLHVALVLSPDYADAYSNMGAVMLRGGLPDSEPAMRVLQRAVQINPGLHTAHSNLSVILAGRGDPDIAVPHNMHAAELCPGPENWSRVLFNLNYCDSWSAERCADEHKRIGALFDQSGALLRLPPPVPAQGSKHRVGFVSPDFRNHSVSYFLRPLLKAMDRGRFEIFCYSDVPKGDEVTAEIRASADHWVEAVGLNDLELAQKVREDRIDTLIDLAGHTPHNRMGAFALRPAPVQMTWLGYANTSGLSTIDYRIVDEITDPPGSADALASETLLRLEGGFLCYGPPPYAPSPAVRPPAEDGAVVFGTFNNPTKITDATFDLWSRLLNRLPKAKLLIKSFRLRDDVLRRHILGKFARNGVAEDRLIMLDANADPVEHLAAYGHMDIGLDPVLYNGTTTTFEALWMGVPVIAERGDRHAGRVGASLLTHIGLPELIGETADDYVEIACRLALDPAKLARLRAGLRQRLAASPLCDAPGFARKFEAALLRAAGRPAPAPDGLQTLQAALGAQPLDLTTIAAARDALVRQIETDPAAIPPLEALVLLCRDLSLLGLRDAAHPPPAGNSLAEVIAHCLKAPSFTLRTLPAFETLPPAAVAVLAALMLEEPPPWSETGAPDRYAAHLEAVLSAAHRQLQAQPDAAAIPEAALLIAASSRFGPAMPSERPMEAAARDRAGLIELWLAGQGASLDHPFPARRRKTPRIGLFRGIWEGSGESGDMLSHLEQLTEQGEIIVYSTHPLGDTPFEQRVRALAGAPRQLPDSIAEAVAALRRDDLDLLLIGHDLTTHLSLPAALCAHRLARRQAVSEASPVPPGFARLDAWLGADPMPPREWIPEGPLPVSLTRAELGIPGDRLLLISAAALPRLTADTLACWGDLLKARRDAHLLLYPFDAGWANLPSLAAAQTNLRALLELDPVDQARVTILPPGVSKAGSRAVLALADLYLDALPSADPADLLDPLSVDLPMLLSSGQEPRHRRVAEIHRLYDLPALLADTPAEYLQMALSLAASADERAALRAKAAAGRARLNDRQPSAALQALVG